MHDLDHQPPLSSEEIYLSFCMSLTQDPVPLY